MPERKTTAYSLQSILCIRKYIQFKKNTNIFENEVIFSFICYMNTVKGKEVQYLHQSWRRCLTYKVNNININNYNTVFHFQMTTPKDYRTIHQIIIAGILKFTH